MTLIEIDDVPNLKVMIFHGYVKQPKGKLVVWMFFPIQLGMSSSQLTFTPSFFRGVGLNHQPVKDGVTS
jgi:hypothetical protein